MTWQLASTSASNPSKRGQMEAAWKSDAILSAVSRVLHRSAPFILGGNLQGQVGDEDRSGTSWELATTLVYSI